MDHEPPPRDVLDAFRCSHEPSPIEGGEGRAYRSGDVILKPIAFPVEAMWIAETLSELVEDGFRVERPVRTVAGDWLSGTWSAWRRVEGDHDRHGRWKEVLHVTEALHRSLEHLSRPAFLDGRYTPWDAGDRAAWGEASPSLLAPIGPLVAELQVNLSPIDQPSQVIHGDMPHNVLFADGLPPAVIDFSPYFRPAGFAAAIVVIDALTWYGAKASILRLVEHIPEIHQLLLRATIYRLVTAATAFTGEAERLGREVEAHLRTLDRLDLPGRT